MKNLVALVTVSLILLNACTVGIDCYLYNNVDNPIQLSGCGRTKIIPSGALEKVNVCDNLTIVFADFTLKYFDFIPSPVDHHKFESYFSYGVAKIILHVQVNNDGQIFIVRDAAHLPALSINQQPDGFPITGEKL